MRIGRITQTAWKRSVRRQLHTEGKQSVFPPSWQENCSGLAGKQELFVWAAAEAAGDAWGNGFYAVLHAAGALAEKGAVPSGVSIRILFPEKAQEEDLRAITAEANAACMRLGAELTGVQGEVSSAVTCTVVTAVAAGLRSAVSARGCEAACRAAADSTKEIPAREKSRKREILLCGYAGLEGTLRILEEAEEELGTRFVSAFLEQTKALRDVLVTPAQVGAVYGAAGAGEELPLIRQIGSGGILAALWDVAEISGLGFEIDMHQIALKQETVEICEYYRLNPYQMTSAGSWLILADNAAAAVEALSGAGARAVRLGTARAQNARVISSGEEKRYLDRPAPDELARWMAARTNNHIFS